MGWQSEHKDLLSSRWRALKRLAIQGHDHERELIFFAGEIKSQRGIRDQVWPNLFNYFHHKPIWQGGARYWLGHFYEWFSDFGRSVMQPLFWLIIFAILFGCFYLGLSIEDKPTLQHNEPVTQVARSCDNLEAAIYLAAHSALPFILTTHYSEKIHQSYACLYGKDREGKANIPNEVVFLSIVQTILSMTLIFLLLLALRNQFKIK